MNRPPRPALRTETRTVSVAELVAAPHARPLSIVEALPLLMSPDSGKALSLKEPPDGVTDGTHHYPMRGAAPLLLPVRLHESFTDRLSVPYRLDYDAFMQYFLLASIKQSGEINAAPANLHFQRHLFRLKRFCQSLAGLVLDVGCDDPVIGTALLPPVTRYIGLDPFCLRQEPFRLIGVGEYLPLQEATVDAVLFNTSLDHILDWRRALDEAWRVLKPGGTLILSTIVWTDRADLLADAVHFHHFREFELLAALEGMTILATERYDYKGDAHRYGLYLSARKQEA
jgi:SAM-dependent methyltransferase